MHGRRRHRRRPYTQRRLLSEFHLILLRHRRTLELSPPQEQLTQTRQMRLYNFVQMLLRQRRQRRWLWRRQHRRLLRPYQSKNLVQHIPMRQLFAPRLEVRY